MPGQNDPDLLVASVEFLVKLALKASKLDPLCDEVDDAVILLAGIAVIDVLLDKKNGVKTPLSGADDGKVRTDGVRVKTDVLSFIL